jgi:hypothetical protein
LKIGFNPPIDFDSIRVNPPNPRHPRLRAEALRGASAFYAFDLFRLYLFYARTLTGRFLCRRRKW